MECCICGCTEDNACITDKGPWLCAFTTRAGPVCSNCVVELPKDSGRRLWPKDNLLIVKLCIDCAHLIEDTIAGKESYTCELAKFDRIDFIHWFALSGIKRPNKTVKAARRSCHDWELHKRWTERDPAVPKLTVLDPEQTEKLWRSGEAMMENPIKREEQQ